VRELDLDIRDWLEHWNEDPRPYVWTWSSAETLEIIACHCNRTAGSGR